MVNLVLNALKEIKRFFCYVIFRIYQIGNKKDKLNDWEDDAYFNMMNFITLASGFIVFFIFNKFTDDYFWDRCGDSKFYKMLYTAIVWLPVRYLFVLLIPFKKVKNLTYTTEERVKYRNVFLVLLGIFVLFVLLRIKGYL